MECKQESQINVFMCVCKLGTCHQFYNLIETLKFIAGTLCIGWAMELVNNLVRKTSRIQWPVLAFYTNCFTIECYSLKGNPFQKNTVSSTDVYLTLLARSTQKIKFLIIHFHKKLKATVQLTVYNFCTIMKLSKKWFFMENTWNKIFHRY